MDECVTYLLYIANGQRRFFVGQDASELDAGQVVALRTRRRITIDQLLVVEPNLFPATSPVVFLTAFGEKSIRLISQAFVGK